MHLRMPLVMLLTTLITLATTTEAKSAAQNPNVVFVLIDDMGYADLSCYGEQRIETTHIDRLASEGIRFTQYYANSPICSPSRTALLTGQYPGRWRLTSYLWTRQANEDRGMANWLDPEAPSYARELQRAGYATGHFGKWHLGGLLDVGEAPLITEYGFDTSLGSPEGLGDRILPIMDAYDGSEPERIDFDSHKLGRGSITWVERSKMTSAHVAPAIEFIRESSAAGKPFFVNLWLNDVHSPFFPPKELRGDETKNGLYLGVVKAMDDQLAPLFDAIRNDAKLRDNTLIIVASDNGHEPGAGSAGLLRGHKSNLYEGGIRVPLIAWGPGVINAKARGTVDEISVISGVDMLPTLLALADVPLPAGVAFDGEDRLDALLGRQPSPRTRPLFWQRPPDRPGPKNNPFPDLAMRDGEWKLLMSYDGGEPQLYNLTDDPGEATNLAGTEPERVELLSRQLLAWYQTIPGGTLN